MNFSLFLSLDIIAFISNCSSSIEVEKINMCNNFLRELNTRTTFSQTYSEDKKERACLELIAEVQNHDYIDKANPIIKKALTIRQQYVNAEQDLIKNIDKYD